MALNHYHVRGVLKIIDRLDAIERAERTVLDDDGIAALIELSDSRDLIREALEHILNQPKGI